MYEVTNPGQVSKLEHAQLPIEVVGYISHTCDTGCGIKVMHYCNFLVSVANCVRDDYTL